MKMPDAAERKVLIDHDVRVGVHRVRAPGMDVGDHAAGRSGLMSVHDRRLTTREKAASAAPPDCARSR